MVVQWEDRFYKVGYPFALHTCLAWVFYVLQTCFAHDGGVLDTC